MRSIKQIKDIKGKRVLLRVDYNVPVKDGVVADDFRIKKSLPTINLLQKKGAKIILISHLGKGGDSLLPVAKVLNKYLKIEFIPEILGENVSNKIKEMKNGDVIMLENLRNDIGEKESDKIFALNLTKLADIYVNEAFSVSHREDASIVLLPKLLPSYAGLQFLAEVENLSKALEKPKHPFLFILGGAKFSTKIPLIEKYLKVADLVFVGGALVNNLLKAKGYEVGKSLVDDVPYEFDKILKNKKLFLLTDVIVEYDGGFTNKKIEDVAKHDVIVDIGKDTTLLLSELVKKSKLIIWNGPLGKYESSKDNATTTVLESIAKAKNESILGGGDLVSFIKDEKGFSFVSTGGGATIQFLAEGTLPGIKALQ